MNHGRTHRRAGIVLHAALLRAEGERAVAYYGKILFPLVAFGKERRRRKIAAEQKEIAVCARRAVQTARIVQIQVAAGGKISGLRRGGHALLLQFFRAERRDERAFGSAPEPEQPAARKQIFSLVIPV